MTLTSQHKIPDVYDALEKLGAKSYKYTGENPTSEEDFYEKFTQTKDDSSGWAVEITDRSELCVTYQQVISTMNKMINEYNQTKNIRERKYPEVEEQLDQLWHDIDDGILGEGAKNSKWYQNISKIKNFSNK